MAHACLSLQDTRVYRKAKRPVAESANLCIDKRGEERCALIPQDLQPLVETTTTTTTATATTTTTTTVAVCKPALKIGLRVVEQCGDASNGTAVRGERGGGKWDKGVRKGEKGEREIRVKRREGVGEGVQAKVTITTQIHWHPQTHMHTHTHNHAHIHNCCE